VLVPERDVLGGVGRGWPVAMATTGSERGLTLRSPGRYLHAATRLLELARAAPDGPGPYRDRVVQSWIEAQAYQLFTLGQVTDIAEGRPTGAESSLNKLFWSELDIRLHETALELLGPEAEAEGPWSKGYQFALAGPVYAGTNEIQRNIVAERLLGLPKG